MTRPSIRFSRNQRRQTEQGRGGKASGIRNQSRVPDRFAIGFRQAVNKLRLRVHRRVLTAVVLLKLGLVAQPKVAGQIDHLHACRQTRHNLHRLSMRQREKHTIEIRQVLEIFRHFAELQIRQPEKISMNFADGFSGVFVGGDESNFDIRMQQQNAQQFRAAIT